LRRALGPTILEKRIEGKRTRTECQKREPDPKRQPFHPNEGWTVNLHEKQSPEHIEGEQKSYQSSKQATDKKQATSKLNRGENRPEQRGQRQMQPLPKSYDPGNMRDFGPAGVDEQDA
jgi:hypothetical protein